MAKDRITSRIYDGVDDRWRNAGERFFSVANSDEHSALKDSLADPKPSKQTTTRLQSKRATANRTPANGRHKIGPLTAFLPMIERARRG
jgi:hypothetical protein